MRTFDPDTLRILRDIDEVTIRTDKRPENALPIWVVVDGDDAFVRSVRGTRGRWYRDLAAGGSATLEIAGRRLAVRVIPANDAAAVDRASREYLRKYRSSPYAPSMVKPEVLQTTLRLEPR
jgi:hypothetical protein